MRPFAQNIVQSITLINDNSIEEHKSEHDTEKAIDVETVSVVSEPCHASPNRL